MGKQKNHHKAQPKPELKISVQKRNELNQIVDSILKLGFKQGGNLNEQYAIYVEIQGLLERVVVIESVLKVKSVQGKSRKDNIEVFTKWVKGHGGKCDGIGISEFPGYDLGLKAEKPINEGDLIIEIPQKIIMCDDTCFSPEILEVIQIVPILEKMKNVRLAFLLIYEKLRQSFWKPYIDILPEKYSTVMNFTVNEMQELKGSNALANTLTQCIAIARQYALLYKSIQNGTGNGTGPGTGSNVFNMLKEKFTYELYRWAVSTVMTRCNFIPRNSLSKENIKEVGKEEDDESVIALIPFWDMANHRNGIVTTSYNCEKSQIESTALSTYAKGDQIFIYYCDKPNFDMLNHNGFVYSENDKDYVNIKLGLSTSDQLFNERTTLLEALGIPKNCEVKVLQSPDFISPQLLAFVRIFNMNKEQLDHWLASNRAGDLFHIDCALETALETKTWIFLQTRLTLLLKIFPTTLQEDETLLMNHQKGQAKLGHIKSLIVQYRILEKKILENALDYVKQRAKA